MNTINSDLGPTGQTWDNNIVEDDESKIYTAANMILGEKFKGSGLEGANGKQVNKQVAEWLTSDEFENFLKGIFPEFSNEDWSEEDYYKARYSRAFENIQSYFKNFASLKDLKDDDIDSFFSKNDNCWAFYGEWETTNDGHATNATMRKNGDGTYVITIHNMGFGSTEDKKIDDDKEIGGEVIKRNIGENLNTCAYVYANLDEESAKIILRKLRELQSVTEEEDYKNKFRKLYDGTCLDEEDINDLNKKDIDDNGIKCPKNLSYNTLLMRMQTGGNCTFASLAAMIYYITVYEFGGFDDSKARELGSRVFRAMDFYCRKSAAEAEINRLKGSIDDTIKKIEQGEDKDKNKESLAKRVRYLDALLESVSNYFNKYILGGDYGRQSAEQAQANRNGKPLENIKNIEKNLQKMANHLSSLRKEINGMLRDYHINIHSEATIDTNGLENYNKITNVLVDPRSPVVKSSSIDIKSYSADFVNFENGLNEIENSLVANDPEITWKAVNDLGNLAKEVDSSEKLDDSFKKLIGCRIRSIILNENFQVDISSVLEKEVDLKMDCLGKFDSISNFFINLRNGNSPDIQEQNLRSIDEQNMYLTLQAQALQVYREIVKRRNNALIEGHGNNQELKLNIEELVISVPEISEIDHCYDRRVIDRRDQLLKFSDKKNENALVFGTNNALETENMKKVFNKLMDETMCTTLIQHENTLQVQTAETVKAIRDSFNKLEENRIAQLEVREKKAKRVLQDNIGSALEDRKRQIGPKIQEANNRLADLQRKDNDLTNQIAALKNDITKISNSISVEDKKHNSKEAELNKKRNEIVQKEKDKTNKENSLTMQRNKANSTLPGEINNIKNNLVKNRRNLETQKGDLEHDLNILDQIKKIREDKNFDNNKVRNKKDSTRAQILGLVGNLKKQNLKKKKYVDIDTNEAALAELDKYINSLNKQINGLTHEIENLDKQINHKGGDINHPSDGIRDRAKEISDLKDTLIPVLEKDIRDLKNEIDRENQVKNNLEEELEILDQNIQDLQSEKKKQEAERQRKENDQQVLLRRINNVEDYIDKLNQRIGDIDDFIKDINSNKVKETEQKLTAEIERLEEERGRIEENIKILAKLNLAEKFADEEYFKIIKGIGSGRALSFIDNEMYWIQDATISRLRKRTIANQGNDINSSWDSSDKLAPSVKELIEDGKTELEGVSKDAEKDGFARRVISIMAEIACQTTNKKEDDLKLDEGDSTKYATEFTRVQTETNGFKTKSLEWLNEDNPEQDIRDNNPYTADLRDTNKNLSEDWKSDDHSPKLNKDVLPDGITAEMPKSHLEKLAKLHDDGNAYARTVANVIGFEEINNGIFKKWGIPDVPKKEERWLDNVNPFAIIGMGDHAKFTNTIDDLQALRTKENIQTRDSRKGTMSWQGKRYEIDPRKVDALTTITTTIANFRPGIPIVDNNGPEFSGETYDRKIKDAEYPANDEDIFPKYEKFEKENTYEVDLKSSKNANKQKNVYNETISELQQNLHGASCVANLAKCNIKNSNNFIDRVISVFSAINNDSESFVNQFEEDNNSNNVQNLIMSLLTSTSSRALIANQIKTKEDVERLTEACLNFLKPWFELEGTRPFTSKNKDKNFILTFNTKRLRGMMACINAVSEVLAMCGQADELCGQGDKLQSDAQKQTRNEIKEIAHNCIDKILNNINEKLLFANVEEEELDEAQVLISKTKLYLALQQSKLAGGLNELSEKLEEKGGDSLVKWHANVIASLAGCSLGNGEPLSFSDFPFGGDELRGFHAEYISKFPKISSEDFQKHAISAAKQIIQHSRQEYESDSHKLLEAANLRKTINYTIEDTSINLSEDGMIFYSGSQVVCDLVTGKSDLIKAGTTVGTFNIANLLDKEEYKSLRQEICAYLGIKETDTLDAEEVKEREYRIIPSSGRFKGKEFRITKLATEYKDRANNTKPTFTITKSGKDNSEISMQIFAMQDKNFHLFDKYFCFTKTLSDGAIYYEFVDRADSETVVYSARKHNNQCDFYRGPITEKELRGSIPSKKYVKFVNLKDVQVLKDLVNGGNSKDKRLDNFEVISYQDDDGNSFLEIPGFVVHGNPIKLKQEKSQSEQSQENPSWVLASNPSLKLISHEELENAINSGDINSKTLGMVSNEENQYISNPMGHNTFGYLAFRADKDPMKFQFIVAEEEAKNEPGLESNQIKIDSKHPFGLVGDVESRKLKINGNDGKPPVVECRDLNWTASKIGSLGEFTIPEVDNKAAAHSALVFAIRALREKNYAQAMGFLKAIPDGISLKESEEDNSIRKLFFEIITKNINPTSDMHALRIHFLLKWLKCDTNNKMLSYIRDKFVDTFNDKIEDFIKKCDNSFAISLRDEGFYYSFLNFSLAEKEFITDRLIKIVKGPKSKAERFKKALAEVCDDQGYDYDAFQGMYYTVFKNLFQGKDKEGISNRFYGLKLNEITVPSLDVGKYNSDNNKKIAAKFLKAVSEINKKIEAIPDEDKKRELIYTNLQKVFEDLKDIYEEPAFTTDRNHNGILNKDIFIKENLEKKRDLLKSEREGLSFRTSDITPTSVSSYTRDRKDEISQGELDSFYALKEKFSDLKTTLQDKKEFLEGEETGKYFTLFEGDPQKIKEKAPEEAQNDNTSAQTKEQSAISSKFSEDYEIEIKEGRKKLLEDARFAPSDGGLSNHGYVDDFIKNVTSALDDSENGFAKEITINGNEEKRPVTGLQAMQQSAHQELQELYLKNFGSYISNRTISGDNMMPVIVELMLNREKPPLISDEDAKKDNVLVTLNFPAQNMQVKMSREDYNTFLKNARVYLLANNMIVKNQFIRGQLKTLQKLNDALQKNPSKDIKAQLRAAFIATNKEIEEQKSFCANDSESENNYGAVANAVGGGITRDELMIYESLSGIRPRVDQAELLKGLFAGNISAFQLIMGGGKTAVLISLLSFYISRRKDFSVPVILSHPSQFESITGNVASYQRDRFNQGSLVLNVTKEDLNTTKGLRKLYRDLQNAKEKKQVVIARTSLLNMLQLTFQEVCQRIKPGFENEDTKKFNYIKDIINFFKKETTGMFDEADMNLSILTETNFPIGTEESLPEKQIADCSKFFRYVGNFNQKRNKDLFKLKNNTQSQQSDEEFEKDLKHLSSYILGQEIQLDSPQREGQKPLTWKEFLKNRLQNELDKLKTEEEAEEKQDAFLKEAFREILYEKKLSEGKNPFQNMDVLDNNDDRQILEQLATFRGIIQTLRSTRKKSANQSYGFTIDNGKPVFRPYIAVGQPSTNEFGNPYEKLTYYYMYAMHDEEVQEGQQDTSLVFAKQNGSAELIRKYFESLQTKIIQEKLAKYSGKNLGEGTTLEKAFEKTVGVTYDEFSKAVEEQKKGINKEYDEIMGKIQKYLKDKPLNRIAIFEKLGGNFIKFHSKQSTSGPISAVDMLGRKIACSGTIWNYETWSEDLNSGIKPDVGTEGKILIKQKQDFKAGIAHTLVPENESVESVLDALSGNNSIQSNLQDFRALIDSGGIFKAYNGETVAKKMLNWVQNKNIDIEGVLFFRPYKGKPGGEFCIVNDSKVVPLQGTTQDDIQNAGFDPNKIAVYYDEAHTVGTDVKFHGTAFAVQTFDPFHTTMRDLNQGSMRMRKLLESQKVHIVCPKSYLKQANANLEQTSENGDSNSFTFEDVIKWTGVNQSTKLKTQLMKSYKAKIDTFYKNLILDRILEQSSEGRNGGISGEATKDFFEKFTSFFETEVGTDVISLFASSKINKEGDKIIQEYYDRQLEKFKKCLENVKSIDSELYNFIQNKLESALNLEKKGKLATVLERAKKTLKGEQFETGESNFGSSVEQEQEQEQEVEQEQEIEQEQEQEIEIELEIAYDVIEPGSLTHQEQEVLFNTDKQIESFDEFTNFNPLKVKECITGKTKSRNEEGEEEEHDVREKFEKIFPDNFYFSNNFIEIIDGIKELNMNRYRTPTYFLLKDGGDVCLVSNQEKENIEKNLKAENVSLYDMQGTCLKGKFRSEDEVQNAINWTNFIYGNIGGLQNASSEWREENLLKRGFPDSDEHKKLCIDWICAQAKAKLDIDKDAHLIKGGYENGEDISKKVGDLIQVKAGYRKEAIAELGKLKPITKDPKEEKRNQEIDNYKNLDALNDFVEKVRKEIGFFKSIWASLLRIFRGLEKMSSYVVRNYVTQSIRTNPGEFNKKFKKLNFEAQINIAGSLEKKDVSTMVKDINKENNNSKKAALNSIKNMMAISQKSVKIFNQSVDDFNKAVTDDNNQIKRIMLNTKMLKRKIDIAKEAIEKEGESDKTQQRLQALTKIKEENLNESN